MFLSHVPAMLSSQQLQGLHNHYRPIYLGDSEPPQALALRPLKEGHGNMYSVAYIARCTIMAHYLLTASYAPVPAGIVDCGKQVVHSEGVRALWKGLTPFATHLTFKYALRMGSNSVYQVSLTSNLKTRVLPPGPGGLKIRSTPGY
jgi:hypothetical protein